MPSPSPDLTAGPCVPHGDRTRLTLERRVIDLPRGRRDPLAVRTERHTDHVRGPLGTDDRLEGITGPGVPDRQQAVLGPFPAGCGEAFPIGAEHDFGGASVAPKKVFNACPVLTSQVFTSPGWK